MHFIIYLKLGSKLQNNFITIAVTTERVCNLNNLVSSSRYFDLIFYYLNFNFNVNIRQFYILTARNMFGFCGIFYYWILLFLQTRISITWIIILLITFPMMEWIRYCFVICLFEIIYMNSKSFCINKLFSYSRIYTSLKLFE